MPIRKSCLAGAAVAVLALGSLAACTGANGPANVYAATAAVPPGEEVVLFKAPGLAATAVTRAGFLANDEREEYTLFRGDGDAQAEVFFAEASSYGYGAQAGDHYVLEYNKTIRMAFGDLNMPKVAHPVFAESYPYKGKLPYYLEPFTRTDTGQSCFGFHAEFNGDVYDPNHRYDDHVVGYYCAPKGTKLTAEGIQAAIDGLDLAGITTPKPAGKPHGIFRQLQNDAALVGQVTRGDPPGQTGMVKFPMNLSRHYGDSPGGDNRPNR